MNIRPTPLDGVILLEATVFDDARGFFFESFNARAFQKASGITANFVQDNHSRSTQGVLRGLHYQIQHPQAKLVRVVAGEVFDVVVDLRRTSPSFGQWHGTILSAENKRQVWVPAGCAHGFLALSKSADVLYKTTDYWNASLERCIAWNDPDLNIAWPLAGKKPKLSAKDAQGIAFCQAETFT